MNNAQEYLIKSAMDKQAGQQFGSIPKQITARRGLLGTPEGLALEKKLTALSELQRRNLSGKGFGKYPMPGTSGRPKLTPRETDMILDSQHV